ncbi:MAG TPA: GNAT family protein [Candidatus Bathyarchaeia archaeon]|nr:GNAT family protein [Candidatus Bathyarchaeia archaeon]
MGLLKGKRVDLKLVEKEDLREWESWLQDPEFRGALEPFPRQVTLADAEKEFLTPSVPGLEFSRYFIQKKDSTRIGIVIHFNAGGSPFRTEIGYILKETARGQGYATEAASIIVDYLFLSRNLERVQAHTVAENSASHKVLERIGFKKEGELRHAGWLRGRWINYYSWSILRSEWANPKILKAT